MAEERNLQVLLRVFNHIAFPPNLPGEADHEGVTEDVRFDLLDRLLAAVNVLNKASGTEYTTIWEESIKKSLKVCRSIHTYINEEAGRINQKALLKNFKELQCGNAVIIYLEQQNACILIRKPHDDDKTVVFETFETSATAEKTLAAKGALQWDFPGMTVSLDSSEFANSSFQDNLVWFISRATVEAVDEFVPKIERAGAKFSETRDTMDPAMITKFLMTLLESNGTRINTQLLRKRVKDDVCWRNVTLPWRRSPFWLTLRVCVQRLLYLRLGEPVGRALYKSLMCCVLAQLLEDSINAFETEKCPSAEECNFLKTKLCRRLAKLEGERGNASPDLSKLYGTLFETLAPLCQKSIDVATRTFESEWSSFKKNSQRLVETLPQKADDKDLYLSLPHSAEHLRTITNFGKRSQQIQQEVVENTVSLAAIDDNKTTEFETMSKHYSLLAMMELELEEQPFRLPTEKSDCEKKCIDIAKQIEDYLGAVGNSYDNDPEQISVYILTVAELWMYMDKCATTAYPLLKRYHPWWEPRWLDMLLLSKPRHIERVRKIQRYLGTRCTKERMTIFTKHSPGCLSDRYFHDDLLVLQERIEGACSNSRDKKILELDELVKEFQNLTQGMESHSCECKIRDGKTDIRQCRYHYCYRSLRRVKKKEIEIHEDFLPPENRAFEKKAVIFELGAPDALIVYRNIAWRIVSSLCLNDSPKGVKPQAMLDEYRQLSQFKEPRDSEITHGLTLASKTKSSLGTHYKLRRIPAPPESVLYPLALRFEYYDPQQQIWLKDIPQKPNFAHRFNVLLPNLFSHFYRSSDFTAAGHGPSSYETIARSTECPPGISIHEGIAHRNLMGGKYRRWFSILIELGSSNINFSRSETTVLFRFLALQIGPRLTEGGSPATNTLKDPLFCRRLMEQIDKRVDSISRNWRETKYMETLLIVVTQVRELACSQSSSQAYDLILNIRRVTHNWMSLLRSRMRDEAAKETIEDAARFCFLSALLCRRTFVSEVYDNETLDEESFKCFTEATLTMQESSVVTINEVHLETRNMLIADIKMSAAMGHMLQSMALKHPDSLQSAINVAWPKEDRTSRTYSEWEFRHDPNERQAHNLRRTPDGNKWWITSIVRATEHTKSQVVHYHLLEGHLLIDGHPIGKLPGKIRESKTVKELFGNERLVAFPSNVPDMSYMLAADKEGYRVHLGYRDTALIVRAYKQNKVLEFIPRNTFGFANHLDLPQFLIERCFHWLDLQSETIEIRHHPWKSRGSDWSLDLSTQKATSSRVSLVDPQSRLFESIARIFHDFEDRQMLTVLQPLGGPLRVELKRMNLTFYVNEKGLLQCKELCAEIDLDQDAGTLYGLSSMLVVRSATDSMQRSIITTMGAAEYFRDEVHVRVRMTNTGTYAKYDIDDILGRLHCPSEPDLLYNKALIHAFTSFFIPDPLTGRTGTEEALSCLQSGSYQPWTTLSSGSLEILAKLANLSPRREYYPKDKRVLQAVQWDADLTICIQHDSYRTVVDSVLKKSKCLSLFDMHKPGPVDSMLLNEHHLHRRAILRRGIYERQGVLSPELSRPEDSAYVARDRWSTSYRISYVREIVSLIRKQPQQLPTTATLLPVLQGSYLIEGYTEMFMPATFDECLSMNIPARWGSLVSTSRDWDREDIYRHMFQFCMVAFSKRVDMGLLRVILCFFLFDDLKSLVYPHYARFVEFRGDEQPKLDTIRKTIEPYCKQCNELEKAEKKAKEQINLGEIRQIEMKKRQHSKECDLECERFSTFLLRQWPCETLSVDGFEAQYLDISQAIRAVSPGWLQLYKNMQLSKHIREVQMVLRQHNGITFAVSPPRTLPDPEILGIGRRQRYIAPQLAQNLLQKDGHRIREFYDMDTLRAWIKQKSVNSTISLRSKAEIAEEVLELEEIIDSTIRSSCSVESRYGQDMKESIHALKAIDAVPEAESFLITFDEGTDHFKDEIKKARSVVRNHYQSIVDALLMNESSFHWLSQANIWPCMTPVTILEQLRSTSKLPVKLHMRESIISYGIEIVKLQQLIRMKGALRNHRVLYQEYKNSGHINWNPSDYPDWLLMEIDSNLQIREEQATVALEIIFPPSGSNSVLQMNMGQGKTSVIMPMVASVLADGKRLARLIVPKALLSQTAEVLQTRLGGLVGRDITHIPFSRKIPTANGIIDSYRNIHETALQSSGVMLEAPEHVLSFKLSGLQKLCDSISTEGVQMVNIQRWMDNVCRDVLDECDFTLAVRTQLIYPSGTQMMVDGHPDRWEVAMTVLQLVAYNIRSLARDFPRSIDIVERSQTGFPFIYFLERDVEVHLVREIVNEICSSQILPMPCFSDEQKDAVKAFISSVQVSSSTVECINNILPEKPQVLKNIYLLRGLLARGILTLCLKRRWNVQYGLHPKRDPMAVPFHAKGVPSDGAEWGHPDVAILLTCLSFYHQGLTKDQLRQSLCVILESDDPSSEYAIWTQTSSSLPETLRDCNMISIDNRWQIEEIWQHLRLSTVVINHFLRNVVFPTHAKQFSNKLQASGWDIPLDNDNEVSSSEGNAGDLSGITTGFSGTNDSRMLLPLTIKQRDLPSLVHINAEVLTYLLQARNRKYILATDVNNRRLSELALLCCLKENKMSILIDAGAFILEMDNRTLAKKWLQEDGTAIAAVYFGPDNKAWVQYRAGKTVPLLSSPFADNLENCLVYIDEAHTRGTDLKLPSDARGALTLGVNQTKDHTVQAAMRLRRLRTTQSITFIAPPEVHQSILHASKKRGTDHLDSSNVITWLLKQTCNTIRDLQPLHYAQGSDFCRRMQAAKRYKDFLQNEAHRAAYMENLNRPEQQSLRQMYPPRNPQANSGASSTVDSSITDRKLSEFMQELNRIDAKSHVGDDSETSALDEVEQEREVANEVEEREVQRPLPMTPLMFPGLDPSISEFVKTGKLRRDGNHVKASVVLSTTNLGLKHGIDASSFMPHLFVSMEFTRTAKLNEGETHDNYIRPVSWILYSTRTEEALVIIPEEAEQFIRLFWDVQNTPVHLILYAAPVTKLMEPFNHLSYYSVPSLPEEWSAPQWLPVEVGILAGRLYFEFSENGLFFVVSVKISRIHRWGFYAKAFHWTKIILYSQREGYRHSQAMPSNPFYLHCTL
ncbi:hypothetical protein Plec18167_000554 [Paecilomyces lecythidis]|uniref:ubiquitinyl hydrolase 1 n=1 Tax=Paecilomyces lecythidis TaxID=3004212 RepID=A0ABR3YEF1_9EURO